MKQYAEYGYYLNDYLRGRETDMSGSDFDFYAVKASKVIERYTFNRIENVTDAVKNCCCELVELMRVESTDTEHHGKTSEKVGDYSVSYTSATEKRTEREAEYRHILHIWLADTDLMYRG